MSVAESSDSGRTNGPRSRKGAQTRARLLEAAEQVFQDAGFLEARVSDIAERAGMSHGSFYHYFESKEEIFREVAETVEERLSAPLWAVILDPESKAPPADRIREAMRRHLESYRREARMMGVIEQVSRYDQQVRESRYQRHLRYNGIIAGSIEQMQARGLADPAIHPEVGAAMLGSMTSRFPELWLVQGYVDCPLEEAVEQLSRLFINALGLSDDFRPKPAKRR